MLLGDEDIRHGTLVGDFLERILDSGAVVYYFLSSAFIFILTDLMEGKQYPSILLPRERELENETHQ